MGVMHKNTATSGLTNPSSAAETVLYTTPAISTGPGEGGVGISGTINITPGTGTTAIVVRVRQGSITGPIVSGAAPSHSAAAGAPQSISFGVTDMTNVPQQVGGIQYVITVQQTGASANGTANVVDVEVLV